MTPTFKTKTAEYQHVMASEILSDMHMLRDNLELVEYRDERLRALVLTLTSCVAQNKKEPIDISEQWPCDWWQAFKERWFPRWALRRWPVRYKSVELHTHKYQRCCPHIRIKAQGRHLEFIGQDSFDEDCLFDYNKRPWESH